MSDDRQKRIERRAYEIWEREGRPSGSESENWRRAQEEIAREEAEADAPQAEPAPAAEPEPAAEIKTAAKAKAAEPEAPSPAPRAAQKAAQKTAPKTAPKTAEKAGASTAEAQEKGTRKRKTAPKKK
jgi:hypothetical protein